MTIYVKRPNKLVKYTCQQCGIQDTTYYKEQKYCGDICTRRASYQRIQARMKGTVKVVYKNDTVFPSKKFDCGHEQKLDFSPKMEYKKFEELNCNQCNS